MKLNPLLAIDYYKATHNKMLDPCVTKSVSYFIPRKSRIKDMDKAVFFGLQGFIKEYLIESFNENFFNRSANEVIDEYKAVMGATMGADYVDLEKIRALHQLGYLPIEIRALPEGASVPMGCPMFCITNTHPDFAWLPQMLESLISCEMWHPIVSATIAKEYRWIADKWYKKSWCKSDPANAMSCFDMRGEESLDDAIKTGAAWATSFNPCATVGTAMYLNRYYNAPLDRTIRGSPSTEHAVMCTNTAVNDGNEKEAVRKLLAMDMPMSIVLDSYDYEAMVKEVLAMDETYKRLRYGPKVLLRGDSGDPQEVVMWTVQTIKSALAKTDWLGRTTAGYITLPKNLRVIYGDSITLKRAESIYEALINAGFSADSVVFGAGSFSFQGIETEDGLAPLTRDTFNIAIKATYAETNQMGPTTKYKFRKEPKGADFKKSPLGCIKVTSDWYGLKWEDNLTWDEADSVDNMLIPVFRNGKMLVERSLDQIRQEVRRW